MGKKMKKKVPNPRKALHRGPAGSPRSTDRKGEVVVLDEGECGVGEACTHYSKTVDDLNRILSSIRSAEGIPSCEHCREEPSNRRGSKEKGKQGKKKGGARVSDSKKDSSFVWVCLDCNRYFCSGEVSVSEPYGHARRHSKQEHHMWAVRADDPLVSWCYSCNSSVPIQMPEEEVAGGSPKSVMDLENAAESLVEESSKGYVVRGLSNLGNTCFFNSVMQNLLATDMLRNYLLSVDRPLGPITMALRKLFVETSSVGDFKNVLSPKALFGSICAKAPQFRGYQQQDSHELLRYLLDGLCVEEMSAGKSSHDSSDEQEKSDSSSCLTFVDAIFGGQISSTVRCMECQHTSVVHEPFLDLSLPVPSKKPAKKSPPPPPKRGKPPLKERNKGRRYREKGIAKGVLVAEPRKEESSSASSECSGSVLPEERREGAGTAVNVDDDFSWLDFLGAPATQSCNDEQVFECSGSVLPGERREDAGTTANADDDFTRLDFVGAPATQSSNFEQVSESESTARDTLDSRFVTCSQDLIVSSDTCEGTSCRNAVLSSCIQDSSVILLPYKEPDRATEEIDCTISNSQTAEEPAPTAEEINGTVSGSQIAENVASLDAPTEVGFDGFGDLFNEPEVTSAPTENGTGEELNITLWTGDNTESNHDEVDDTSSVSINSCLALFTKPELLSNDQAWYCERCSKIAAQRKAKLKTVAVLDEGETSSKLPSLGMFLDSPEPVVSGDKKMASDPRNLVSQVEKFDDLSARENGPKKPLDLIGGSAINMEVRKGGSSNLLDPDILQKDEENAESDNSSHYVTCPSAEESILHQDNFTKQDFDFCSVNDLDSVERDRPVMKAASGRNGSSGEVKHSGKEALQLLNKSRPMDGNEDEEVESKAKKVKRDATKRILIYRTPPVLTIHLKRFSQDNHGRLNKLRGHVSFQEFLDLKPYMDPRCEKDKCEYRLIGVVEHSGGMHGGHYIAYVRGEKGGGKAQRGGGPAWFHASDAYVREVTLSEVLQSEAYILFYERV